MKRLSLSAPSPSCLINKYTAAVVVAATAALAKLKVEIFLLFPLQKEEEEGEPKMGEESNTQNGIREGDEGPKSLCVGKRRQRIFKIFFFFILTSKTVMQKVREREGEGGRSAPSNWPLSTRTQQVRHPNLPQRVCVYYNKKNLQPLKNLPLSLPPRRESLFFHLRLSVR